MTIQSVSFSAVAKFQPQTVRGVQCDGVIDGRPFKVYRSRTGGYVPAVGTVVSTSVGEGIVIAAGESCIVEILEFNDRTFAFYDEDTLELIGNLSAREHCKDLAAAANRANASLAADIRRIEVTLDGNVTKAALERIDSLHEFEPNQIVVSWGPDHEFAEDVEVLVRELPVERETVAQQKARLRRERRAAKRLADEMLENLEVPEDIQAELEAEFGDGF